MKRSRAARKTPLLVAVLIVALVVASCQPVSPRKAAVTPSSRLSTDSKIALASGVKRWSVGTQPGLVGRTEREIEAAGGRVESVSADGALVVATFPDRAAAAEGVGDLAIMPSVAYVEPDLKTCRALYTPSDSRYADEWGLHGDNSVHADTAWNTSTGSASVVIAVVDTGVDADHPDLQGRVDVSRGTNLVTNTNDADDDHGHGTHVAGIAAASIDQGWVVGVAPGCTILPIKVLDADGSGYPSDVALGIRYAVDHGADIINMSLGSDSSSTSLATACQYALEHGVSVVAAAGNSAHSSPSYPAAYAGVIGVSAIGRDGSRAAWSNYGSQVDLCAPGVRILSCAAHGSVVEMSGTSMASPFVAGSLAALRSRWPSLTRVQAEDHLLATADPKPDSAENFYGSGLVDVARAVSEVPSGVDNGEVGDGFPAQPIAGTITTGTLDASNTADAYSMPLLAGQRVTATLEGASGTDFDVWLCPPGSVNAHLAMAVAAGTSTHKTLSYTVRTTGTYYLCVRRAEGDGEYTLTYRPGVSLGRPYPTAAPRRGVTRTWIGSVRPAHEVASHPVTLRCYRRVAGHWRYWMRTGTTVAENHGGTRYTARLRLPSGRWLVVPVAASDARHVSTTGPGRAVTVR